MRGSHRLFFPFGIFGFGGGGGKSIVFATASVSHARSIHARARERTDGRTDSFRPSSLPLISFGSDISLTRRDTFFPRTEMQFVSDAQLNSAAHESFDVKAQDQEYLLLVNDSHDSE